MLASASDRASEDRVILEVQSRLFVLSRKSAFRLLRVRWGISGIEQLPSMIHLDRELQSIEPLLLFMKSGIFETAPDAGK